MDRNTDIHQPRTELTAGGFSALLGAAADAIVIIDNKGHILNINDATRRLFGYSSDEITGRNVSMLMPSPYQEEHDAYLKQYVQTRVAKIIGIGRRVEALKKDGTVFPIELSVGEYVDNEKQYFIGIIRDLSERERIEAALRESQGSLRDREESLRVTLKNAPIGIITATLAGDILSANHAACKLTGHTEAELTGKHCFSLISKEDIESTRENHNAIARGQMPAFEQNTRMLRKDGEIIHVVLHCASVAGEEGKPERLVAQLVDITDQVKAENDASKIREKFAHVDRVSTMGEMASGIAHEINQPLSAISAYVQASLRRLDSPDLDSDKIREILGKVDEQSQRAGEIVRRIRSLIRTHDREREVIDVNELVFDIINLANADASNKGFTLSVELMETPCEVIVDRIQIQQVILNLVRNAVDATVATGIRSGSIIVGSSAGESPGQVEIWVRDFGVGLEDDIRHNMFDSFVTTKPTGTGMGLSISRSIIEAHGGKLWATSMKPGTQFSFELPVSTTNE